MERVLENEVMDTPAEAVAYDEMDHAEVNTRFVDDLFAVVGSLSPATRIVDLGTGTAQIPIELCLRMPELRVVAIDAAASMLEVGRENLAAAGLADRVDLLLRDAKVVPRDIGLFDVVMSNSLAHHLPEPGRMFEVAMAMAAPGAMLFVRDLFRPATSGELDHLVSTYAGDADPAQRQMFADSLGAALTVEEVQQIVALHGFPPESVAATSDRHWTFAARRP